jgi:hypothetical protein
MITRWSVEGGPAALAALVGKLAADSRLAITAAEIGAARNAGRDVSTP